MNRENGNIYQGLIDKANSLSKGLEIDWYYPGHSLKNPLKAQIGKDWQKWDKKKPAKIYKNKKNWFYADIVFPKSFFNFKLENQTAYIQIDTYSPFKLWLDGKQAYEEIYNWAATGPIADPLVTVIECGKTYRIVYCIEPTEIPAVFNPLAIHIIPYPCLEYAARLFAFSTELKLADCLAKVEKEKNLITKVCTGFDHFILKRNNWRKVTDYINQAEDILRPLSPKAKSHTVHLIAHNHIDMDWQWTWKDTVYCFRRDAKSALSLMEDRQDLTMSMSQVPFYQVIQEKDPDLFKKIKHFIEEGRWINSAGTWVEGDLNKSDGEALARQMQYATDWCLKNLGNKSEILWEPDTFGHPGNMPQLAQLGEYKTYFHWRCNPGGQESWPVRNWQGIDGSSIFSISSPYGGSLLPGPEEYYVFYNLFNSIRIGLRNTHHIWGCGDHGGGLPRYQLELLEKNIDRPLLPTVKFSTFEAYKKAVLSEGVDLKHNIGVTHHLFEGCYTTHSMINRYNRQCESELLIAESLTALAVQNENKALQDAWLLVLFNQFHDILCGAAVHDAYRDAVQRYKRSLKSCDQLIEKSLNALFKLDAKGSTFTLLNPSAFMRSEIICSKTLKGISGLSDATGKAIAVQQFQGKGYIYAQNVPALAAAHFQIEKEEKATTKLNIEESDLHFIIDTPLYTSRISKQCGAIVSYHHKELGRNFIDYGVPKILSHTNVTRMDLAMNVFQIIDEAPNPMSAWLINDILKSENLLRNAKVRLVSNGPVFACFEVIHHVRSSTIREFIYFYQQADNIDFDIEVDWREIGSNQHGVPQLKLSFASAMSEARAHFEGPFSIAEYPADGREQVTQKFMDLTGREFGFTLLNNGCYGVDCLGGRARITLLRNSYSPDPNSDNGIHRYRVAFIPHNANFNPGETSRRGLAFNRRLIDARTLEAVKTQIPGLSIKGSDLVICTAHRVAEHSKEILLRFYETSGTQGKIKVFYKKGFKDTREVNFQETVLRQCTSPDKGWLKLNFRPYEVKTILFTSKH